MKELVAEHVIACTPERFWSLWFDPDWHRTYLIDGMGYLDCAIGPVRAEGEAKLRDMTVTPRVAIPRALQRVVGERLSYVERGRFDGRRWSYTLSLAALSAFRGGGTVELEAQPDGRCRRIARMHFAVDMPVVGRKIAATAADNAAGELDRGAAYINRWLAKHTA